MEGVEGIADYYSGKNVLVTGGCGFLGKSLIEKLLRSCPSLGNIYMIIRPKRGHGIQQRFNKVTNSMLFENIRKKMPDVLATKLIPVEGDITADKLGLSDSVYEEVVSNVHVVFHLAASIKFNDPLAMAIKSNLVGTKQVVDLALQIKHLESFVHVSTAYSNCNRSEIHETYYRPPLKWFEVLDIMNKTDEASFEILAPKILGDFPNTYTYTKCLAEDLVWDHRHLFPVVIMRPSVVIAAFEDPIPGWMDNLYGPAGFMFGAAKGVIRVMLSDADGHAGYIPVDVATRATIAAAWYRHTHKELDDEDHIYNVNNVQSLTNKEILENCYQHMEKSPLRYNILRVSMVFTKSWPFFVFLFYYKQLLPAIFIDALLKLIRKKPILMKIQMKYYKGMELIGFFLLRMWTFHIDHFRRLGRSIPEKEKKDFELHLDDIDPDGYMQSGLHFGRVYVLKDPPGKPGEFWFRTKMVALLEKSLTLLQLSVASGFIYFMARCCGFKAF